MGVLPTRTIVPSRIREEKAKAKKRGVHGGHCPSRNKEKKRGFATVEQQVSLGRPEGEFWGGLSKEKDSQKKHNIKQGASATNFGRVMLWGNILLAASEGCRGRKHRGYTRHGKLIRVGHEKSQQSRGTALVLDL